MTTNDNRKRLQLAIGSIVEPHLSEAEEFRSEELEQVERFRRYIRQEYDVGVRLASYHEIIAPAMDLRDIDRREMGEYLGVGESSFSKWDNNWAAPPWPTLNAMNRFFGFDQTLRPSFLAEQYWAHRKLIRWTTKRMWPEDEDKRDKKKVLPAILKAAELEFLIEAHSIPVPSTDREALFEQISSETKRAWPYFQFHDFERVLRTDGATYGVAVLEIQHAIEVGKQLHRPAVVELSQ